MANEPRRQITLDKIHKWAGLAAALWLGILAITGFLQLNQDWSWQWAGGLPISERLTDSDDKHLWRYLQINPANPRTRVVGGAAGAFLTNDGGEHWRRLQFGPSSVRNVAALEPAMINGQWSIVAATDRGVWRLDPGQSSFTPIGLQGQRVNALSVDGQTAVAAVGMSRVMRLPSILEATEWQPVRMGPPPAGPGAELDLGRLLQDIHMGRGVFGGMIDRIAWNITAIGLLLLALTGASYWLFLRGWTRSRMQPASQRPPKQALQRLQKAVRWSFRVHAMIIGIVLALPLLIIFTTGIYQDHRTDVQQVFRGILVPTWLQPPVYRAGSTWRGQVMNLASTHDAAGSLLVIGNRNGVFLSRGEGATWVRDASFRGPAMRMRKIGDRLFVPGRMLRRVQVRDSGGWRLLEAPRPVVMANELSSGPNGRIWWVRGTQIMITDEDGHMRGRRSQALPQLGYMPWASLAAELHRGTLISRQWKWINDLAALLGLTLVVTGFLRWRRRRW